MRKWGHPTFREHHKTQGCQYVVPELVQEPISQIRTLRVQGGETLKEWAPSRLQEPAARSVGAFSCLSLCAYMTGWFVEASGCIPVPSFDF